MNKFALLTLVSSLTLSVSAAQKPNIVLIMADDMGFSDIGCYGGEVQTPNLDKLASQGVRFKQFYNSARCCPTRASLMTGLYPHQTGIGHMTNTPNNPTQHNYGLPGYQGYLNKECVTIAEMLKLNGYQTLMTGKWHLGRVFNKLCHVNKNECFKIYMIW
ncbi:sulfatase-like hydrolase/transferase [Sunxiuqinia rutila]|uniref:sulfatase-like hydrolase/transferase n=1 Tax=Sunxiuqinia rutila TaxID=1397841 RepID=UPI003D36E421